MRVPRVRVTPGGELVMRSLNRRGFLRGVVGASIAFPELGCSRLSRDNLFKLKKGMTTSELRR
jgi:hypothetical protein